jgi:hypothetical protein
MKQLILSDFPSKRGDRERGPIHGGIIGQQKQYSFAPLQMHIDRSNRSGHRKLFPR